MRESIEMVGRCVMHDNKCTNLSARIIVNKSTNLSDRIIVNTGMRTRRSKQIWMEAIKKDTLMLHVTENMTLNRKELYGRKRFM